MRTALLPDSTINMKPYRYLLLTTVSLSLFACGGEDGEDPIVPPVDPDTPVALSPQIGSVALTKATATADDIAAIGLYAVNNVASENHYGTFPQGTYGQYTLQGGSLKPATISGKDQTIWLSTQQAIVYSCYPVTEATTVTPAGSAPSPVYTIPVPANAITYSNAVTSASSLDFTVPGNDYMYGVAYNTTTKTFGTTQPIADNGHRASDSKGEKINLGLKHAFCLVSLKFKKHTDYAGPCNLTKITYSRPIPALQTDGTSTMSLKDGTLGNLTGANASTPVKYEYTINSGVTLAATTDGIEFINYGVPFPSGTANVTAATLTVVVDGKEMKLEDITDGGEWSAGNKYTYTISIHGTGLKLDGFNVVGWTNESSDNTSTTI